MKLLLVEQHVMKSPHNNYILHTHDMCSCYLSEMDSSMSGYRFWLTHSKCTRKLHSALVKWLSKM